MSPRVRWIAALAAVAACAVLPASAGARGLSLYYSIAGEGMFGLDVANPQVPWQAVNWTASNPNGMVLVPLVERKGTPEARWRRYLYFVTYPGVFSRELDPSRLSRAGQPPLSRVKFRIEQGYAWQPLGLSSRDGWVYYVDDGLRKLGRIRAGTAWRTPQLLALTPSLPFQTAVAPRAVYWTNQTGGISRSNLDGSGVVGTFIDQPGARAGLVVADDHLYWADRKQGAIGRAALDGTGQDPAWVSVGCTPWGLTYLNGWMYWTCPGTGQIGRVRLDGQGADPGWFSSAPNDPQLLAVVAPPLAPGRLHAKATGRTEVQLRWTQPDPVKRWRVRRRAAAGGAWTVLARSARTTSFTDSTAAPATAYRYSVEAVGPGGWSTPRTAKATTPGPPDPTPPSPSPTPTPTPTPSPSPSPSPSPTPSPSPSPSPSPTPTPSPSPAPSPAPTPGLALTQLWLSHGRFAPGRRNTAITAIHRGTTIRLKVSEAAEIQVSLRKASPFTPEPGWLPRPVLSRDVPKGTNAIPFSGRLNGSPLSRGRWRMWVTATANGTTTPARSVAFTITR